MSATPGMQRHNTTARAPLASIALISASALAYELLLMRVFAIVHWGHLVGVAISLALLGYGASGTFLVLARRRLAAHFGAAYVINALAFAVLAVTGVAIAQQVGFDPQALIWEPAQVVRLTAAFLVLALPFFAAANCIGMVLSRFDRQIPRIYGVDLVAAGAGAGLFLAALSVLRPEDLIAAVAVCAAAGAALGARALRWRPVTTLVAAPIVIGATLLSQWPSVGPAAYKDLARAMAVSGAEALLEADGVMGRLNVVGNDSVPLRIAPGMSLQTDAVPPRQLGVYVDGDAVGTLPAADPDGDATTYLGSLISALAYALPRSTERVAVLNAGTGLGVRQAVAHGALHVIAVEPNAELQRIVCDRSVTRDTASCMPGVVSWQTGTARTFARDANGRVDHIQLALPADAAGLDALGIDYAATVEALRDYLGRLDDAGTLGLSGPTRTPPRMSMNLLATAQQALAHSGSAAPARHLALLRGWQHFALLVSKRPLDRQDLDAVRAFATRLGFDLVWLPDMRADEANRFQQLREPLYHQRAVGLLHGRDDRVHVISDDRPYPRLPPASCVTCALFDLSDDVTRSRPDTGVVVGVAIPLIVLGAALLLILVPLFALRAGGRGSTRGDALRTLAYFGVIGVAFLVIEIAWIQRLQLFLGHPAYAATAVLAAFLVFAGAGSLWSQRATPDAGRRRLWAAVLLIAVSALVYLRLLPGWLDGMAGLPIGLRIAAVVMLIAPLAFAMGVPFPTALRALGLRTPTLIPWAWGINGCASVVAAAATPLLGSQIGFAGLTAGAAGAYLLLPLIGLVRKPSH